MPALLYQNQYIYVAPGVDSVEVSLSYKRLSIDPSTVLFVYGDYGFEALISRYPILAL